ncbi:MAG: hypothetical protein JWP41_1879, partial [Ramlibacter sp.]|nr:hypothetical protein [Ramlibacter sp.]
MFKVNLSMYLWDSYSLDSSTQRAVLYRHDLELPFVPAAGLELQFPLERPRRLK